MPKKSKESDAKNEQAAKTIAVGELVSVLRTVARSLGVVAVRMAPSRPRSDSDRMSFLKGLGFDRNDIAGILGTTPETVSSRLSEKRSKKVRRKRARGKDQS
jgi:CRP-like cAMP-binding protein